jgi:HlyD family secretion protein
MTRYRLLLVVFALAALAALAAFWPFSSRQKGLDLPGTVQSQEVRLSSKVGGRVAAVLVAEGDRVSAGQELVRLELPELEAQRDQLKAKLAHANAELYKARKGALPLELREAEAAWKVADARYRRVVAGPRQEEIEQAEQDKKSAEADLAAAQDQYQRLNASRQASRADEVESARFRRARASAALAAAKSRLQQLRAGNRTEDREEAKAERDRLKAKYDLLRDGTRQEDVARAEADAEHAAASLREVEAKLREAVISAREAGRVEVISVRPGDVPSANAPVVRMLRDGDQWVRVFVPENELGKVRVGQKVEVTIDSHPGKKFPGVVYHVAGESEFTPRNVQSPDERRHQVFAVKVRVEAPAGVFKPGMAAQVFIPTGKESE